MILADGGTDGIPNWVLWLVGFCVTTIPTTVIWIMWRNEKVRHKAACDEIERINLAQCQELERRRIADEQEQSRRQSDDDRDSKRQEKRDELDKARSLFQHAQIKELVTLLRDQLKSAQDEIQRLKEEMRNHD